ncbi:MAG: YicC/YloC family endoribonuclease [Clostridium sp.]
MVKSMTSFGRATSEEGSERVYSVEMKSVNHRYLDMNIRMPKIMYSFEEKIRKMISSSLNRGKVDIFINSKNYGKNEGVAELNKDLAQSYINCLKELVSEFGVRDDISATAISRLPEVITVVEKEENAEEIFKEISPLVEEALKMMENMRVAEGSELKEDILSKLTIIEGHVKEIEKIADAVPTNYKRKLEERIKELTSNVEVDQSRIAMEVALFADKATVDEEITRLYSHITQMRETLNLSEPIGRKLDFIIQEMNRETNTIGSKSSDMDMTNIVINIKNLIEKIREQVQNIE